MPSDKLTKTIPVLLTLAIVVLLIISVYATWNLTTFLSNRPTPTVPPEIDVYKIVPTNCPDCFSIDLAEQFVRQTSKANIITTKTLKLDTPEAKEFVTTYKLKRLPALIIKGEIKRVTLQHFEQRDDALVFDQTPPPYIDVPTGNTKGKVTATILRDATCHQCLDVSILIAQLRTAGVSITTTTIDAKKPEGRKLISHYNLERLPTILFSKDALEYDIINQVWDQVGSKENDGTLILRKLTPPFKDVASDSIIEQPSIIYLTDKSCAKCYDVMLQKKLLMSNFGMQFSTEQTIDTSSKDGVRLITKYDIKAVPTVIVSSEAQYYPGFADVWQRVGATANDGSFIFTNMALLQGMTYKDLKNQTTVTVPTTSKN